MIMMKLLIEHKENDIIFKLVISDDEHKSISTNNEIDFVHSGDISIESTEKFKNNLIELLHNIKINKT